jgi:hypothetical protein
VERKRGDFTRSRNDSRTESLTMTGSNVKCRAREWSRRESSDIDGQTDRSK